MTIITNPIQVIVKPDVKQLIVSKTGLKGDKGEAGNSKRIFSFSWGDANPHKLITLSPNEKLISAAIFITNSFNIPSSISVGTLSNPNEFVSDYQNDTMVSAIYEVSTNFIATTSTDVYLFINPGFGTVQGSGFIILEVY